MHRYLRILTASLFVCLCFAAAQPAEAQVWKKAKEAAEKKLKERAEQKAEEAGEKAADAAADRIEAAAVREAKEANLGGGLGLEAGAQGEADPANGPVDFRSLKALLPERAAGFARTNAEGERGGAFGIRVSNATGTYEDGNARLKITVTDLGTLRHAAMLGYGWLAAEVESESDNGYQRTTEYEGFPAYEALERGNGYVRSEMQVVIGQRFVVAVEGDGVPMERVRQALGQVDLQKLAALAPAETAVEPADFEALKALLPGEAGGLDRMNAAGQKTEAMGVRLSSAEGTYGKGDEHLQITITDMGTLQSAALLGFSWLAVQVNTEDDNGYQRTAKYNGLPAYEELTRGDAPRAQMQVVVGQRFLVAVEGNVSMDRVRQALDRVDLQKLAALK